MPEVSKVPAALRPFVFHGVSFEIRSHEAVGTCPFCGREGKFSINVESDGLWRCLTCAAGSERGGGNLLTFLRLLHEHSYEQTPGHAYEMLAADRGLLDTSTPVLWGLAKSLLTDEWLLPGYNPAGKLCNLYRYTDPRPGHRRLLLATPGLPVTLFGLDHYSPKRPEVYVCEGPWDGMVLWETMRMGKWGPGVRELLHTASPSASLLEDASVVAVPGCGAFAESWASLFPDARVHLLYDNDYPRLWCRACRRSHPCAGPGPLPGRCPGCGAPTGDSSVAPAAWTGMMRAAGVLASAERPPSEVYYLDWMGDGSNHDPALAGGYDVRDLLTEHADIDGRLRALEGLLAKTRPVPADWVKGRSGRAVSAGAVLLEPEECTSWEALRTAWRKALKWTEGLDRALSVMLAAVASTGHVGDQLWVKIMSPASTGKSKLCEALSVARRWVEPWSSIRGFHSGVKTDKAGEEDHSLIVRIANKTLVTKDGDTLLTTPNRDQVLSEGRDLYDRVSRAHYRHGLARRYENLSVTWILCGTGSLRLLDASELGERFLSCYIMETIDPELERDIGRRSAYLVRNSFGLMVNGDGETSDTREMVAAKRLTAGYVCHLREDAAGLMRQVQMSDEAVEACVEMGTFVSHIRARPSRKQDEVTEREMSARLANQLTLLAGCLAVVLQRPSVDEEVMRRVRQVALDTARGKTLQIVQYLHRLGPTGADPMAVALMSGDTEDRQRPLMQFLARIGVVEAFLPDNGRIVRSARRRWRLTGRMRGLYETAYEGRPVGEL